MAAEREQVTKPAGGPLAFDSFSFDAYSGVLRRGEIEISLPPRAFAVLACLLEDPGRIVPKQELLDRVWPETTVTDHSLSEAVRALRSALGDTPTSPKYIQTVHRRGYRFCAEVVRPSAAADSGRSLSNHDAAPAPATSLRSGGLTQQAIVRVAALLVAAATLGLLLVTVLDDQIAAPESVLTLSLPEDAAMRVSQNLLNFAISGDGHSVLYAGSERGMLHVRRLGKPEFEPLGGTELARGATFSPDGNEIAYLQWDPNNDADRSTPFRLLRRSLDDGNEVQLATGIGRTTGIAWGEDGTIVWGTETEPGLWLLRPGDEKPTLIADQSGDYYVWPHFLSGGGHLIATARSCLGTNCPRGGGEAAIVWISLVSGEQTEILPGDGRARFVAGGYLAVGRDGQVLAAPFDPAEMTLTGELVSVLEGVMPARLHPVRGIHESVYFDASPTGTLLWVASDASSPVGDLQLVDRAGNANRLPIRLRQPILSPNGKHIVGVADGENGGDLFIHEIGAGTAIKALTRDRLASTPVWSPSGKRVTFADRTRGNNDIYSMPVSGARPELLYDGAYDLTPESWSPDGRILAFTEEHPDTQEDIWLLTPEGEPVPFLRTPFVEYGAAFSHDGNWIAYHSDRSGAFEIYVRRVPEDLGSIDPSGAGYLQQVSTDCGGWPVWAHTGPELFYRRCRFPESFFAVSIDGETGARISAPVRLFGGDFARPHPGPSFSVTPAADFLLVDTSAAIRRVEVWQNWTQQLKRLTSSATR